MTTNTNTSTTTIETTTTETTRDLHKGDWVWVDMDGHPEGRVHETCTITVPAVMDLAGNVVPAHTVGGVVVDHLYSRGAGPVDLEVYWVEVVHLDYDRNLADIASEIAYCEGEMERVAFPSQIDALRQRLETARAADDRMKRLGSAWLAAQVDD